MNAKSLVAALITVLVGFLHANAQLQPTLAEEMIYAPNVQLGPEFQASLMVHNGSPQHGRARIIPYTAAGVALEYAAKLVDVQPFEVVVISIAELPLDTRSLVIRASYFIDASLNIASIDGQQTEIIPAAKSLLRLLAFPTGIDRSSFADSTLSLFNPAKSPAEIKVELVDDDGQVLASASGSQLPPMNSTDMRLSDTFDTESLNAATLVRVTASSEIAGIALSTDAGAPLLALPPNQPDVTETTADFSRQVKRYQSEPALAAAPVSSVQPARPVSKNITLGFNKSVSWRTKPHNGIDYVSTLSNTIPTVGPNGNIHSYTSVTASAFGSINPDYAGPAIWAQHTLATGQPVYVLYGHTASSWVDKTQLATKTLAFKFNCTYTLTWRSGDAIKNGAVMGRSAPYYNAGKPAQHLHLSVFLPNKTCNNAYCGPPRDGWGYSDIILSTGTFIDPEMFFSNPAYKLKQ